MHLHVRELGTRYNPPCHGEPPPPPTWFEVRWYSNQYKDGGGSGEGTKLYYVCLTLSKIVLRQVKSRVRGRIGTYFDQQPPRYRVITEALVIFQLKAVAVKRG